MIIPDIVICNTKEVISVIELKYLPRGQPQYKKDVKNLALISEKRKQIKIANERFRGEVKDNNDYHLFNNILFVWACVHAKPKNEIDKLYSDGYKSLTNSFIQLHAETKYNSMPEIYTME